MGIEIRAPQNVRVASPYGLGDWHDGEWFVAQGCTKVSPGCENCTAAALSTDTPFANATESGRAQWSGVVRPNEKQLTVTPSRWEGRLKLFVGGMTDFWHEALSDDFRARVFEIIYQHPENTYGFLTKRAKEMHEWYRRVQPVLTENVWLGTTVETDAYRGRLDYLLDIPAAVRYAQCEPLLDRVHLRRYLEGDDGLDWVVAGPEWGCPNPRPCQAAWMRQLRDDCAEFNVPFFTRHLLDGCEHRHYPTP
jgi:protein gp37